LLKLAQREMFPRELRLIENKSERHTRKNIDKSNDTDYSFIIYVRGSEYE